MGEKVIFPLVSGINWPSNVLQVWLTLHDIGITEYQMRLLPEFGYLTAPEVVEEDVEEDPYPDDPAISLRHPHGPQYDSRTQLTTVHYVDPGEVRPRLKVHVRSETLMHFDVDQTDDLAYREEVVGRLAHFMLPMTTGLPQAGTSTKPIEAARQKERPLRTMVRQVCARYPELMATIPISGRDALEAMFESLEKALQADELQARLPFIREITEGVSKQGDLDLCRRALLSLLEKLEFMPPEGMEGYIWRGNVLRFRRWADVLFVPDAKVRALQIEEHLGGMDKTQCTEQCRILEQLSEVIAFEYPAEREKVVRELLEIMTTVAFTATAASDLLWGLDYLHGTFSDYCPAEQPTKHDGLFLSVMGGLQRGQLLVTLLSQWAEQGGFLGVSYRKPGEDGERRSLSGMLELVPLLNEAECRELWALVTLRRQAADPIILFETAAQRLAHPELHVELRRFLQAPGRFGSLFAQLQQPGETGGTAVLGGKAMLHYPGVEIHVPLAEDANEQAIKAKEVLRILIRLFMPVCFHVQIVWQESVARMGQGAYLQHDFQQGVRLATGLQALNAKEQTGDPVVL